jgi:hypothetical protein
MVGGETINLIDSVHFTNLFRANSMAAHRNETAAATDKAECVEDTASAASATDAVDAVVCVAHAADKG